VLFLGSVQKLLLNYNPYHIYLPLGVLWFCDYKPREVRAMNEKEMKKNDAKTNYPYLCGCYLRGLERDNGGRL